MAVRSKFTAGQVKIAQRNGVTAVTYCDALAFAETLPRAFRTASQYENCERPIPANFRFRGDSWVAHFYHSGDVCYISRIKE